MEGERGSRTRWVGERPFHPRTSSHPRAMLFWRSAGVRGDGRSTPRGWKVRVAGMEGAHHLHPPPSIRGKRSCASGRGCVRCGRWGVAAALARWMAAAGGKESRRARARMERNRGVLACGGFGAADGGRGWKESRRARARRETNRGVLAAGRTGMCGGDAAARTAA
jgi:hypothetical protein